jgi:hypothetical protein
LALPLTQRPARASQHDPGDDHQLAFGFEHGSSRAWWLLLLVVAAVLVAPVVVRLVSRSTPGTNGTPSYLPALEAEREREVPFDPQPIDDLRRLRPRWVFIGDSMLGTRIDATQLAVATGNRGLALLAHAGTGSAFWYLALKNWVIASNVKPAYVFVFFRDENMTDPMFRVTGTYRWSLDRVARSHEPALNDVLAMHTAGPWYRLHQVLDQSFGVAPVARAAEAAVRGLPTRWFVASAPERAAFDARMNELFGLERLRPIPEADMQKADDARLDFEREVKRSVLPEMARLARLHDFTLVLVRVQRRPQPDGPPPQSPAMRRYVEALAHWSRDHGVVFHDDTGAPELTLAMYEDGDHIDRAYQSFYTDWFRRTLAPLFQ